jgi:hypothetical protein
MVLLSIKPCRLESIPALAAGRPYLMRSPTDGDTKEGNCSAGSFEIPDLLRPSSAKLLLL